MLSSSVRRKVPSNLVEQLRCLSHSSAALQAAPAVQESTQKSPGFLAKLFGASNRIDVSLNDPLPGYTEPAPVAPPQSPPTTQSTTLSNGVKVASEATYGPTTTVGIFVDSGSVFETPETVGCSHLLEYMAFKGTQNRTTFRLVRELEGLGANVIASASREQMVYSIDAISTNVSEVVEVLSDAVLNPKFNPWEVREAAAKLQEDLKKYKTNHQAEITEAIHAVGYNGALARPLVCPEDAAARLTGETLSRFVADNYTANRIVFAGAGVAHEELVPLVEPLVADLPKGSAAQQPPSQYLGGDYRRSTADPLTHVALGFEFKGGWRDLKGSVAITVLQFLLGGGGAFSSGGPGKGMHSRLYRNVLSKHYWAHNVVAFNTLYNETGLVGIMASVDTQHAGQSVDVLVKELQALTKNVSTEDLQRAKNAAVCQVLVNLESRAVVAEDIGRQALTYGHRKPTKEFLDAINALQPGDISKLVTKLLKTPLTYAVVGDVANTPRYEQVSKMFN